MKFTAAALALAFGLASAAPSPAGGPTDPGHWAPPTVHLTLHGAAASYSLAIPANGQLVYTNSALSINIIDANGFNAKRNCWFTFGPQQPPVLVGDSVLQVGPPQPVIAVACNPPY